MAQLEPSISRRGMFDKEGNFQFSEVEVGGELLVDVMNDVKLCSRWAYNL